jgi:hypothetical protein
VSRARLRNALQSRVTADPAVVPLLEGHAARLEQLADDRWPLEAEAQARMLRGAQALYGLDAVTIGCGPRGERVEIAREVIRRLRPVLGERAGIAVVLPAAPAEVRADIVRALGAEEPDLFLLLGDDPIDPSVESLGDFFGAALLPIGHGAAAGLVALAPDDFLFADPLPGSWLYTTTTEIDAAADPHAVRSAIDRLRGRREP